MALCEENGAACPQQISDEWLRLAIAAGGIGTWDYDPATGSTIVSAEVRSMFGLGESRLVTPEAIFSMLAEEARGNARQAFRRALDPRGDGHYRAEYRIRRADNGEERWIKSIGRAFFSDGRLVRVIGTCRDVTDEVSTQRHLAEKTRLAEELATMGACVASVPGVVGTMYRSPEGKECFPYLSAKFNEVYGLDPEEAKIDLAAIVARRHPDDAERYRAAILESARNGTVLHHQFRWFHPHKGMVWLEVQGAPMAQSDGGCVWHGYVQDITARKRAEDELRASEARFRAIFEAGLIGVFYCNAATGAVTDANDRFLEMVGRSREDLEAGAMNWRELTSPANRAAAEAASAELMRTGKILHLESEGLRTDGSRIPVLVACALLDKSSCEAVAFVLDISEQKLNEQRERRRHADRLATMRNLAAGIAHEINQPLAALGTYLKAMRRLLQMPQDKRPRSVLETLDNASAQVARAGAIVSKMRSFIAHGEPDQFRLNAHGLIHEALHTTAANIDAAGVKTSLLLDATQDEVLADRTQMVLVLVNLISNAIEAMRPASRRELVISSASDEKEIRVDVADTGPGLSEKIKPHLFEPFAATRPSGMGVGLSISHAIINAHHGRIWAESPPEGGAVFSFAIPLANYRGEAEEAGETPVEGRAADALEGEADNVPRNAQGP
ncbi:PAS domain-containing sensor histidine kinase [Methylocystis heyeri]|uniref:histidine kinase n=1 Tax=Methylocystis heyeri TaxID=391905 RepID=A0A6B8KFY9_9HYPH|nr:PAS domain-containing protein [Methylocystis heyeri]QGM45921.1 PAS domain-containing protein [Methylocystis heyeri]